MQHESISVPTHTPSSAVLTAKRRYNHTYLPPKAHKAHSNASAALQSIVEPLHGCAIASQQIRAELDQLGGES